MDESEYYKNITQDVFARTLWGEARGEGLLGLEAVASVILNRVALAQARKIIWWGQDIMHVCLKPFQFSCWNTDDPSRPKLFAVTKANREFQRCLSVASRAMAGRIPDATGGATHYHTATVTPAWSRGQKPTAIIGHHIFFKLKG